MKFIQRLKVDKKFRFKIFLAFVVIVLIYGEMGSKDIKKNFKEQSECDLYNTDWFCYWENYIVPSGTGCNDIEDAPVCHSNDCWEAVELIDINEQGCFGCVPAGLYVTTSDACCSLNAEYSQNPKYNGYDYICKSGKPDPDDLCDSRFEEQIASLVKMIPGMGGFSCKSRFYLGAFTMGFLALMGIMAAM